MRRCYSGRTDAMVESREGEQGFWPSYADMMSAVALILFFLMLLSYISNMITGNNLKDTEQQLGETRIQLMEREKELNELESTLALTKQQVEEAASELEKVSIDLDEVKLTLAAKEEDLAAQDKLLADQKAMLDDQEAVLKDQESKLSQQQALIGEQENYLQAATEEILELRGQMETIVGVRRSVLEQIRDSVVAVMGDSSKVKIDNGNIVLSEGVFFDVGSYAIKPDAIPMLNQLIDVFQRFLSDEGNRQYVDSIVISGHADSTGNVQDNRTLSSARANAVLGYLLDNGGGKLQQYASSFCASGYGDTRPVASNDTEEGRAQNRRIEISIILKDESIMNIVNNYLELELPANVQAEAQAAG
ncbi:MAG: OmpA family protein [Oscillospiraceae bacterium]|nr:OmpA family protein [Oscillospiraceae bacterium]